MHLLSEIFQAYDRIRPHTLFTPLLPSPVLSQRNGGAVFLKLESEQYTGSFKARGSMNKVLSLSDAQRAGGIITASTGNHALGLARALRQADCSGTVYMPTNAVASKVEALKSYPVELVFAGNNSLETELEARSVAERTGAIWVSPYNDPKIIGGQGTIGIELLQQLADVDVVFATVGGGGLIAGIATYVKYLNPQTKIVGCLPERSPEMALSVKAGKIVTLEEAQETISDGSAGGVEPEAITFPVCQQLVDEFVLVSEQEIKSAIRLVVEQHHKIIEGAAGVAVAAFVKTAEKWPHKKAAIIICGSNIATSTLVDILSD